MKLYFKRKYNQNVRTGNLFKKDILIIQTEMSVYFENKDKNLVNDDIKKIGEKIVNKILNSSKEISNGLSKSTYDKFEEKNKEELKEYKDHPKFPKGFKVKEITKEEFNKSFPEIQYPEGGLFHGYPEWSALYSLQLDGFNVLLAFKITRESPIVTEKYLKELVKIMKTDFNANADEIIKSLRQEPDKSIFDEMLKHIHQQPIIFTEEEFERKFKNKDSYFVTEEMAKRKAVELNERDKADKWTVIPMYVRKNDGKDRYFLVVKK